MGDFGRHRRDAQSVAAGETLTLEFSNLGPHEMATCLVKAVLDAGAALTISARVKPDNDDVTDWFTTKIVDLTGASAAALVASVAMPATATVALFAIPFPVGAVEVSIVAGVGGGAALDVWLMTNG